MLLQTNMRKRRRHWQAIRFSMRSISTCAMANGVVWPDGSRRGWDFRQAKIVAGRSAVYLKDIRYRLGGFAKAFNLEVRELVAQDVADYLEELKLHSRSFNNHLSMLRTFFRFCQARGWLSTHVNLLSRVERRSGSGSDIEIFTPEELRRLLAAASSRIVTCLAVQAFAGVRTEELFRLTWRDLERRPGNIEI